MKKRSKKAKKPLKKVESLSHPKAKRKNIPTAQHQPFMTAEQQKPKPVSFPRPRSNPSPALREASQHRDMDADPQLVWKHKKPASAADLTAKLHPLYIQEKVHPKALIDDLKAPSPKGQAKQANLFEDAFDGLPAKDKVSFYHHGVDWQNRMILGDSLAVMASLAEKEGLSGQVQTIYFDPPYGIKFNSNFQWTTGNRAVKDGETSQITREPEQVKAFRDTWKHGVHSYLDYIRDRLTIGRELLRFNGSIFLQIGDENVHLMRSLLDEIFGRENFVSMITYRTTSGVSQKRSVRRISDYILWYAKEKEEMKFNRIYEDKPFDLTMYGKIELPDYSRRSITAKEKRNPFAIPDAAKPFMTLPMHSMGSAGDQEPRNAFRKSWPIPNARSWTYGMEGFNRLLKASRVNPESTVLRAVFYHEDYPIIELTNSWEDTGPEISKNYICQTHPKVIQRCILMSSDEGDLVLDPTCGKRHDGVCGGAMGQAVDSD